VLLIFLVERFGALVGAELLLQRGAGAGFVAAPPGFLGPFAPFPRLGAGPVHLLAEHDFVGDHAGHVGTHALQLLLHVDDELVEHALGVFETFEQRRDVGANHQRKRLEPAHVQSPRV